MGDRSFKPQLSGQVFSASASTASALSRSCSRGTIRLLQDFKEKLFMTHLSEELRDEDDCLEELTEVTRIKFG